MRGSGDTPNLSGDYSREDTILSGEAASKSPGTGEQFLSGGDERGVVFTHRGRHRGRLSGSLIQGVKYYVKYHEIAKKFYQMMLEFQQIIELS